MALKGKARKIAKYNIQILESDIKTLRDKMASAKDARKRAEIGIQLVELEEESRKLRRRTYRTRSTSKKKKGFLG